MATLADALEEAYATQQHGIILHTIELYHPLFRDAQNQPTALRIVRDTVDLYAPLEATAVLNAGETVLFKALHFEVTPPEEDDKGSAEMQLSIDNVSRELMPFLKIAASSADQTFVTYRPYLSDLIDDGVQMSIPPRLVLSSVRVTGKTVTATARMEDITNRKFLSKRVTVEDYPSLGA